MSNCPRCGYPLVHRPDGVEWCSVYGMHAHVVPQVPCRRQRSPLGDIVTRSIDELLERIKAAA